MYIQIPTLQESSLTIKTRRSQNTGNWYLQFDFGPRKGSIPCSIEHLEELQEFLKNPSENLLNFSWWYQEYTLLGRTHIHAPNVLELTFFNHNPNTKHRNKQVWVFLKDFEKAVSEGLTQKTNEEGKPCRKKTNGGSQPFSCTCCCCCRCCPKKSYQPSYQPFC